MSGTFWTLLETSGYFWYLLAPFVDFLCPGPPTSSNIKKSVKNPTCAGLVDLT
jgi:hypothetical protein